MKYLQADNTIDIISPRFSEDYSLFFGPMNATIEIGSHVVVQDFDRTSEVLVFLGLVDSKSWCRKNGWDKPLSEGYQEITFGKLKHRICILR